MWKFIESLESRRLLSTVTLAAAETKLASDISTLAADAGHAKVALIDDVKTFKSDLQALHLQNGPLKSGLVNAVGSARSKLQADVSHIIGAGYKDGQAVVSDVLHITLFDGGNAAKIANSQKRLAADLKTLQTLETPLVAKLTTDVTTAITQINGAVQAIITANGDNQALQTDWATLSATFQSAQQALAPDLTNVISDLNALTTAT
ncbi:MAG TPA: hypothetical protein VG326_16895 [Tepidisphaeraceae bacterium]|nr:hypothetical protein [Tepidisphaeraceae bacterium]